MIPKQIGYTSYYLVMSSIVLLLLTLLASQNVNILHFSDQNKLAFDTQIALSLLNSFISVSAASAIIQGNPLGRNIWLGWSILYLGINTWQLDSTYFALVQLAEVFIVGSLLTASPAVSYFDRVRSRRKKLVSRRVDSRFDIFEQ